MPARPWIPAALFAALLIVLAPSWSRAQSTVVTGGYDAMGAWPLCGNYFTSAPDALDCPDSRHGSLFHRDDTNDTFGPRLIGTRYDWHRGLDLDTDGQTNRFVYAYSCGVVVDVDTSDGRPNYSVTLRHHRDETCSGTLPTATTPCGANGCYYTRYKHLQNVFVAEGDTVDRGELLGGSGANCEFDPSVTDPQLPRTCDKVGSSKVCTCTPVSTYAGACPNPDANGQCPDFNPVRYQCSAADSSQADCYEHVHFEVRDSYGSASPGKGYSQRKAIHPLTALPYDNSDTSDIQLAFVGSVNAAPEVTVDVTMANTDHSGYSGGFPEADMDLQRVEVEIYENKTTHLALIDQQSASAFTTPDHDAYEVSPPFIDFVGRSRQYNYEHTSSNCGPGHMDAETCLEYDLTFVDTGSHPSPFASTDRCFPSSYDADYHLEGQLLDPAEVADPSIDCDDITVLDSAVGDFNGIELAPGNFNFSSPDYELRVTFKDLDNPSSLSKRCVRAFAIDARGVVNSTLEAGHCTVTNLPPAPTSVDVEPMLCFNYNIVSWSAVPAATYYRVYTSTSSNFFPATFRAQTASTHQVLQLNGTHHVRVHACNAAGCSSGTVGDEPTGSIPWCY